MLNGSSSCTASSSIPKKKIATSVDAGTTARWFQLLPNGSHRAKGNSNSQHERNRAVCLVYTKGTGEVNIRLHVSKASPSKITLLSISTRRFSSTGNAFMARPKSASACNGRFGARSNRFAEDASSRVSNARCNAISSSGPETRFARHRVKLHVAHRILCKCWSFEMV
eukprot:CAMPEP_0197132948 /NCGR_PEP_ID=MMETSP1390-20130617/25369_1 /TAXON_ID=38833 /ORGANISM="Micromonas sp., Strain CCMP2099" /LENGTH=167 /DNA_ID=CAMNT_0042575619 /DNA_START=72 /DNA_END=575 /DNA_ORIENTATION=-